jgi:hypothetical protein
MNAPSGNMKYTVALKSIAARYCRPGDASRLSNRLCNGISKPRKFSLWLVNARLAGVHVNSEELSMTPLSKTLVAAAALAAMATSAFSQVPWEFNPGMAYMYSGPGKMTAMAMASTSKNHEAMMKDAKKVPENIVFFMDGGQLFSVSGTLDPTGNFYRP